MNKFLVREPRSGTQIGIYVAITPDDAVSTCLADPAVRPLLERLASQVFKDRIHNLRRRAHEGVDRGWCDREIARLKAEVRASPLSVLVGALEALDVAALQRIYRRHVEHEVENRMMRSIETVRDEKAGRQTFESYDIRIGGFNFHAQCVRYDSDRPGETEVEIELILPEAQKPLGGPEDALTWQGSGRVPKTA